MFKCKVCEFEGWNQAMGKHYKKNPSHRPGSKSKAVDVTSEPVTVESLSAVERIDSIDCLKKNHSLR